MNRASICRISGIALVALSLVALLAVLGGVNQPPERDEGAAAHIFQLAIAALVPAGALFGATADWGRPLRNAAVILASAAILVIAFARLYRFEHPG